MIKLLKYEFKQTWKMCTTLMIFTLVGCIGLILGPIKEQSIIFPLYMILCFLIIGGSSIFLFIYCVGSFNQEFTQPQGYLMMTLPIKARDLVGAKFINQGMWNGLLALLITSAFSLFFKKYLSLEVMTEMMNQSIFIQSILNSIASYVLTVFIIYFSIALLSKEPRDRHYNFIKLIVAMILSHSINIILGLISIFLPYGLKHGVPTSLEHLEQLGYYVQSNIGSINRVNVTMTLIVAVIFYFMTTSLIDKKVQI